MTKATSGAEERGWALLRVFCRVLSFSLLTVLPLGGLILFFEMTQPVHVSGTGFYATQMASSGIDRSKLGDHADLASGALRIAAHFKGVSAELRRFDVATDIPKAFTSSDAKQAIGNAAFSGLRVGFQTEFVTSDHRRFALRIFSREPLIDQAVPDNMSLMAVTPASTAKVVAFVWGQWLYMAEIEDRGVEPEVVVQKVL